MVDIEECCSESDPLIGRVLCGKWRIERLIGRGGMGAVYEATHRNGLKVAVKVLKTERTSSSRMRARFAREGHVANMVAHPGVVAVLDDDADDETGSLFLVMELLAGETLAKRAERAAQPLDVVLRILERVLEVVCAAHEKGIIHRDIKPENVFLTEAGEVKLLDFGLARLRERQEPAGNHTESGAALGTLGFMAPEQARGRWDLVDGRTDVWAVGALAFRLLTGRPVHRARTPNELLIAAATEPAPSVTVRAWDLPRKVVELVDRALAFEKERRWPTAQEMLAALRSAQAETPGELMTRAYAGSEPPSHAEVATEKTNSPVTGEPAAVSSNVVNSEQRAKAAPKRSKVARVPRWLFAAAGITGIGATLALTWQAGRDGESVADPMSSTESPVGAMPPAPSFRTGTETAIQYGHRDSKTKQAGQAIGSPNTERVETPSTPRKHKVSPVRIPIATSANPENRGAVVEERGVPTPPGKKTSNTPGGSHQEQGSPATDHDILDVFD